MIFYWYNCTAGTTVPATKKFLTAWKILTLFQSNQHASLNHKHNRTLQQIPGDARPGCSWETGQEFVRALFHAANTGSIHSGGTGKQRAVNPPKYCTSTIFFPDFYSTSNQDHLSGWQHSLWESVHPGDLKHHTQWSRRGAGDGTSGTLIPCPTSLCVADVLAMGQAPFPLCLVSSTAFTWPPVQPAPAASPLYISQQRTQRVCSQPISTSHIVHFTDFEEWSPTLLHLVLQPLPPTVKLHSCNFSRGPLDYGIVKTGKIRGLNSFATYHEKEDYMNSSQ